MSYVWYWVRYHIWYHWARERFEIELIERIRLGGKRKQEKTRKREHQERENWKRRGKNEKTRKTGKRQEERGKEPSPFAWVAISTSKHLPPTIFVAFASYNTQISTSFMPPYGDQCIRIRTTKCLWSWCVLYSGNPINVRKNCAKSSPVLCPCARLNGA